MDYKSGCMYRCRLQRCLYRCRPHRCLYQHKVHTRCLQTLTRTSCMSSQHNSLNLSTIFIYLSRKRNGTICMVWEREREKNERSHVETCACARCGKNNYMAMHNIKTIWKVTYVHRRIKLQGALNGSLVITSARSTVPYIKVHDWIPNISNKEPKTKRYCSWNFTTVRIQPISTHWPCVWWTAGAQKRALIERYSVSSVEDGKIWPKKKPRD